MSIDSLHGRFALDVQGMAQVGREGGDNGEALRQAAGQFEAIYLQMMLSAMRDAIPESGLLKSSQGDFYNDLMDQQWAQHLSGRGIGLAEQLVRQLGGEPPPGQDIRALIAGIPRGEPVVLAHRDDPVQTDTGPVSTAASLAESGLQPAARTAAAATGPVPSTRFAATGDPVRDFVEQLAPAAEAVGRRTGIPAELMVAQAALETGWGRFRITTEQGADSHNLFGIKAGDNWQGETARVITHEYIDGRRVQVEQTFRVYASPEAAFDDYARLLADSPRYRGVITATNAEQAAQALQDGGYATDPGYADKLVAVIRTARG